MEKRGRDCKDSASGGIVNRNNAGAVHGGNIRHVHSACENYISLHGFFKFFNAASAGGKLQPFLQHGLVSFADDPVRKRRGDGTDVF